MSIARTIDDRFTVPLYTLTEASAFIRVPRATLTTWADGYEHQGHAADRSQNLPHTGSSARPWAQSSAHRTTARASTPRGCGFCPWLPFARWAIEGCHVGCTAWRRCVDASTHDTPVMTALIVAGVSALAALLGVCIGRFLDSAAEARRWRRDARLASGASAIAGLETVLDYALRMTLPESQRTAEQKSKRDRQGFGEAARPLSTNLSSLSLVGDPVVRDAAAAAWASNASTLGAHPSREDLAFAQGLPEDEQPWMIPAPPITAPAPATNNGGGGGGVRYQCQNVPWSGGCNGFYNGIDWTKNQIDDGWSSVENEVESDTGDIENEAEGVLASL